MGPKSGLIIYRLKYGLIYSIIFFIIKLRSNVLKISTMKKALETHQKNRTHIKCLITKNILS